MAGPFPLLQLYFSSHADFCLVSGMCYDDPEGFAHTVPIFSAFSSYFWGRGQAKPAAGTHLSRLTSVPMEVLCSLIAAQDKDFGLFSSQSHPLPGRQWARRSQLQRKSGAQSCHVKKKKPRTRHS